MKEACLTINIWTGTRAKALPGNFSDLAENFVPHLEHIAGFCAQGYQSGEVQDERFSGWWTLASGQARTGTVKVYMVEGEHFYQPGMPRTLHFREAGANQAAADLVNILLEAVQLKPRATPKNWKDRLLAARKRKAREIGCSVEELDDDESNGDVWVTEIEVRQ